jgi:CheY-like chemotaxis protein
MLSHELRNPLAPIRAGLDLLSVEDIEHQDTIMVMQQQVEHLVRLVDDLLDVSRIMRGKIALRRCAVDVTELVKRVVETLRLSMESANHQFRVVLPTSPVWIHADAVRIKQVVENLLKNACKYTDHGGKISITVSLEQQDAVIVVNDNGIGIDNDLLGRVFELFTQSPQTLDRAQGGLGIGLTLVKNLVEMHQGIVSAASEGIGCGSTFEVRLPVCKPPQATDTVEPVRHGCGPIRILAVDDNRGARMVLARLFERLGPHQVQTAKDGPSALQQFDLFAPHLVVLDIGLPGMSGFDVAREIRRECRHDAVLLVALTGYGQKEDHQKSKEAGFDLHLVKPPGIEQLRELLRHPKLARTG